MSTIPSYPFDPTGTLSSNAIANEQQVITAVNYRDYHFIVPFSGPYFLDSMSITVTDQQGKVTPLDFGIDWYGCFEFISASRACAKPIWGGISILNTQLSGILTLNYQTVGGSYCIDLNKVSELLAYNLRDPRVTAWEEVVAQPTTFPPVSHEWNLVDMVGMSELVLELQNLENAIRDANGASLAAHLADFNNPHHTTATQTGLGNVQNFPIATPADVTLGTSNSCYMTPAMTYLMLNGAGSNGALLLAHINNTSNPHDTTAEEVGAYTKAATDAAIAAAIATRLGVTATAADSLLFGGMNVTDYANYVLSGTASNSILFDGYTLAQVSQQIINSVATAGGTDAATFGGQTPSEYMASVLAGTAANAATVYGMDQPTLTAAILAGTAANATLFGNQTPSAFAAQVLQGTSANSNMFGGLTPADFTAQVLAGTAANATLFDGKTLAEVTQNIQAGIGIDPTQLTHRASISAITGEVGTGNPGYWTMIASNFVGNGNLDSQFILTGAASTVNGAQTQPGAWLIRLSMNGTSPVVQMDVTLLSPTDPGVIFGYTVVTTTDSNNVTTNTIYIWMETGANMTGSTITELSADNWVMTSGSVAGSANHASAQPTGFTSVTADALVTQSQLSNVMETMTTTINALAATISAS